MKPLCQHRTNQLVLNPDFHEVCTHFQIPQLEKIISAVIELFSDDLAETLLPLWGRGLGVYKRILTMPLAMPLPFVLEFQVPVGRKTETTTKKILLVVPPGREDGNNFRDRREGILFTIQHAALGLNRMIPNAAFDDVLQEHGRIVKMTAFQNHEGSQCLNSNRYCVLDPAGKGTLPSQISVKNPTTGKIQQLEKSNNWKNPTTGKIIQFYTQYKGQEWYCRRCNRMQVGG